MSNVNFEALEELNKSLEEIAILAKISRAYLTLNKTNKCELMQRAIILFLGTHLECFFESIAEEYVYKIEQMSLPRDKIPEHFLMSYVNNYFNDQLLSQINKKSIRCKPGLIKLAEIVSCSSPVTELKIDTSFSYGKHGSSELKSLFDRIGINNIFEKCKVYTYEESMLSEERIKNDVDIKSKFDTLTGIRNALIHQNTSPRREMVIQIIDDVQHYKAFCTSLSLYMAQQITVLKKLKTPDEAHA
ncbi:HEPN domain-containing protein [Aeromonas schubertii]|uniref:HEPN domain-containing protein n=1 Tax=Aeromonas schubertii TaxID=652 RepID=UPI0038B4252C